MKAIKPLLTIGTLAAIIGTVFFKVMSHFPMMPLAATVEAGEVDEAFRGCLYLTIPIYALVIATLIYILIAFRAKESSDQGSGFESSRGYRVEASWILMSTILTVGLAIFGAKELRAIQGNHQADMDIQVNASQFSWEFYYPQHDYYSPVLLLPQGKRVRLLLTSKDVVHSFWVPQFRTKQDAIPGKVVSLILTPTVIGTYTLLCNELCGMDHTLMTAQVDVMDAQAFEDRIKGGAKGSSDDTF